MNLRRSALLIACLTSVGTLALVVRADQPAQSTAEGPKSAWPSWRGPDSNGSIASGSYAAKWGPDENLVWKVALPGKGCSTPIVWGDHVIVTSPMEGEDAVLDLDSKGMIRWRTKLGKDRGGKHRNGSGSNPSPVTDGTHIVAYYRSGNLAGLDMDGDVLWKTNLQKRFGKDELWWDIGTSPVLTEKHAVVAVLHGGESYLAAFEKKGGELAWKIARNYECPVEGDHAYTTPIVVRHGEGQALVVWGAEHLTAHDAADGRVLWSCAGFNPEQRSNWVAVSSPVISGDIVVVPYGRGSLLTGVRLGGEGDVTDTHRLWTQKEIGSFVPTPAAHGDKVYVVRDKGEVVCVDPKTGETSWSDRLPKDRAKYYSSPMVADGKLYAAREDGTVIVARISDQFEVLSENDMGERIIASPVPAGGRLLLRGERHLFCVAAPK